jgi:fido (protein-threonine AMPylation protein)
VNNTYQILLNWDKGQPFAERMAAKILAIEGYSNLDPQCPTGGPDGTKDILCEKDGRRLVVGCYFPNGQKTIADITEKFSHDYGGMAKNSVDGFVFVTNQKITPAERFTLSAKFSSSEIYHGERVCGALDSPKGYGIRLEYLGVELTKAEQISFLNSYLDLKENFEDIKIALDTIRRTTVKMAGAFESRDLVSYEKLSVLPIAGIQLSSRISVEDLQALHLACLYETVFLNSPASIGFRKMQVWIGVPGCTQEDADYIPPSPTEVPRRVNELLEWWRKEYMDVLYAAAQAKVLAIAKFHESFLSIHPFLDGNGRVARVLASIQYRDLLGQQIVFEELENLKEYYEALQLARQGGHQALVDMFLSLAK